MLIMQMVCVRLYFSLFSLICEFCSGSFHLLSMTLSEYALLVLEGQQDDREHRQMENNVQKHMKQAGKYNGDHIMI